MMRPCPRCGEHWPKMICRCLRCDAWYLFKGVPIACTFEILSNAINEFDPMTSAGLSSARRSVTVAASSSVVRQPVAAATITQPVRQRDPYSSEDSQCTTTSPLPEPPASEEESVNDYARKIVSRMSKGCLMEQKSLRSMVKTQLRKSLTWYLKWRAHVPDFNFWPRGKNFLEKG